jgi:hypothetical protein
MNQVWHAAGSKAIALELTPKTIEQQRITPQMTTANAAPALTPSQMMAHPEIKKPALMARYWDQVLGWLSK